MLPVRIRKNQVKKKIAAIYDVLISSLIIEAGRKSHIK